MSNHLEDSEEILLSCVLDICGVDRLLEKLRKVHGVDGRPDIAAEVTAARRMMQQHQAIAAEMVPA